MRKSTNALKNKFPKILMSFLILKILYNRKRFSDCFSAIFIYKKLLSFNVYLNF